MISLFAKVQLILNSSIIMFNKNGAVLRKISIFATDNGVAQTASLCQ